MPSAGSIPIVSLKPVSCGTTMWRQSGVLQITVVVKATFGMMHDGTARLIAPTPLVVEDRYASAMGSLVEPNDLAPHMPNAGILLSGHAYAPRPMPAVTVRLAVYRDRPLVDKVLHVFGDRASASAAPIPFQKMPITYERAHGGPTFIDNPVGTGATVESRTQPNIVHPADPRRLGGFGPLSSRWGARRRLLMGRAEPVVEVPDGFDFRWFQAAPSDQQCDYLHGDEWIVIDGMHPTLPRLQTQLPSVRAQAVWVAPGPRGLEGKHLQLSADTLLIDADRQLCQLVWRGHFALEKADVLPRLRILTGVELPGYPIVWPEDACLDPRAPAPAIEDDDTTERAPTERIVISRMRAPTLPFSKVAPGDQGPRFAPPIQADDTDGERADLNTTITGPMISPFKSALPFNKNAPPALISSMPATPAPPRQGFGDTGTASTSPFVVSPLPFAKPQDDAAPSSSRGAPPSVRSAWSDDGDAHTRMIDPALVAAQSSLPFAGAPRGVADPQTTQLAGTPWAGVAPAAIETSDPGAETIMARATDLRRLPFPGASAPPVAPPPPVAAPVMVAPPAVAPAPVAPPMIAPPPVAAPEPIPVAPLMTLAAPPPMVPMVAPPMVVPPMVAPPMVAAPAVVAAMAVPPAPPSQPAMAAAPPEAPPSMRGESPKPADPAALTGVRADVVARVKAREALRDLPLAGADLSDLDLTSALLAGVDLRGTKLTRTKLVDARLGDAQLADADLVEADLTRADLTRTDLSRAALGLARFDDAILTEAHLVGAHGHGARFHGAKASRARFSRGEWDGASFAKADLSHADFTGASIAAARFEGATLVEIRLTDARGRGAVFDDARLPQALAHGAALQAASFARADAAGSAWESATLDEASFAGATLNDANLSRASIARVDFTGANLAGANLQRVTGDGAKLRDARMDKADLRQARLREARFTGASMRGVLAGKADLGGARFTRADLEGATLRAARLGNASFVHANLEGADLRDADLDHTNLFGASRKTAKIGTRGIVETDPGPEGDDA